MQLFGEETEHLGELGCHNVLGSISTCAFFKNLAEIQALSKVTGYSHLSRTSVGIIVSHMVIYLLRVMFPDQQFLKPPRRRSHLAVLSSLSVRVHRSIWKSEKMSAYPEMINKKVKNALVLAAHEIPSSSITELLSSTV